MRVRKATPQNETTPVNEPKTCFSLPSAPTLYAHNILNTVFGGRGGLEKLVPEKNDRIAMAVFVQRLMDLDLITTDKHHGKGIEVPPSAGAVKELKRIIAKMDAGDAMSEADAYLAMYHIRELVKNW